MKVLGFVRGMQSVFHKEGTKISIYVISNFRPLSLLIIIKHSPEFAYFHTSLLYLMNNPVLLSPLLG